MTAVSSTSSLIGLMMTMIFKVVKLQQVLFSLTIVLLSLLWFISSDSGSLQAQEPEITVIEDDDGNPTDFLLEKPKDKKTIIKHIQKTINRILPKHIYKNQSQTIIVKIPIYVVKEVQKIVISKQTKTIISKRLPKRDPNFVLFDIGVSEGNFKQLNDCYEAFKSNKWPLEDKKQKSKKIIDGRQQWVVFSAAAPYFKNRWPFLDYEMDYWARTYKKPLAAVSSEMKNAFDEKISSVINNWEEDQIELWLFSDNTYDNEEWKTILQVNEENKDGHNLNLLVDINKCCFTYQDKKYDKNSSNLKCFN